MSDEERSEFDCQMMTIALRIAERGLGNVAPNPSVGAVIVDETTREVIARGWTQPGGRPHAETEAIARAGGRARGSTLYVTLEPCSHHGKTPPCAEAVIAAGIKRVVCGIEDPDPRVAGRGLDMLREAGIEVVTRVCAREAAWVTRGHILRVSERRPMVWLKMAMSGNGTVPRGEDGRPVWVTGEQARAHGHLLRATSDAILIGRGTLDDDDPELTCRLPGLIAQSPRPIVLAGRALPVPSRRLVAAARQNALWIFVTGEAAEGAEADALRAAGCQISRVGNVGGRIWLPAVMEHLVAAGITRLLVEGGPQIWRSFFEARLVDAVAQYTTCEAGISPVQHREAADRSLQAMAGGQPFLLFDSRQIGDDRLYLYRRRRTARATDGS